MFNDKVGAGIDGDAIYPHLIMKVRARTLSRIPALRDLLALAHPIPLFNLDLGEMGELGHYPLAVIQYYGLAVAVTYPC